jgi:hypothetical protein
MVKGGIGKSFETASDLPVELIIAILKSNLVFGGLKVAGAARPLMNFSILFG